MRIIKVSNPDVGAQRAFEIYEDALAKGTQVLGLATGATPIKLYEKFVDSSLDFSDLTAINLDEYVGLTPRDPQSYHYFMQQHLFQYKPFKQTFIPDGASDDIEQAAKAYDDIIAQHPIDLQLLGLGQNGHIGFNEPGTPFNSTTHVVNLTESTIAANARFFDNPAAVPTQAISMGIASVMSAKKILLLAFGEAKATAVAAMVNGPVTEALPASILQEHADVTIIIDDAAASKL
ncbi:glucosamine-6-phosphate deaminase [Leuconostoc lactis]|uniref:glucosamine-6-phosphate deaminase n=1 Tax=Leuconostoc lactis TaxID=1246 RepID=UPI00189A3E7A|nr:glucosamine-6-phosphate deaminase [Leuconostoc lactis]